MCIRDRPEPEPVPTRLESTDLEWSNAGTFDAGGSEGIVNGFWGSEVTSVSTTVPVAEGFTTAVLRLRYWAIDSWDGGEHARVAVDGTAVWELDRAEGAHSCGGFSAYSGDANIPDPWAGGNENHRCYFDLEYFICLLYTSPSPRDQRGSRMPSSA